LRKRGRDITTRCLGGRRVPHLHERGRLREIEARKLGVVEGGVSYRCNRGRDHKRALKVGVRLSEKAPSPISTSEVAFERSRPVSSVFQKASEPIIVIVEGITSVPSRPVS